MVHEGAATTWKSTYFRNSFCAFNISSLWESLQCGAGE